MKTKLVNYFFKFKEIYDDTYFLGKLKNVLKFLIIFFCFLELSNCLLVLFKTIDSDVV